MEPIEFAMKAYCVFAVIALLALCFIIYEVYLKKKNTNPKERILCAAIHFETGELQSHQPKNITTGMVMCGHRHGCIFGQFAGLTVKDRRDIGITELSQGFLTNLNRYVEREEAAIIARDAGQIVKNGSKDWSKVKDHEWGTFTARLFSEDLY